jgi:hypothetical protein
MFLKKIFLSLSFLFFSLNLSAEYYGAGMLLYYKDIEAQEVRFIFGYDSESKNITWGDLGGRCDWRVDRSFEHAAARFAYYATKGIFIELEESLVDNYERGIEFFRLKTLGNFYVRNPRLAYDLFFVELTEDEFDNFTDSYDYLKEFSELGDEYNRFSNFAVVSGSILRRVVNETRENCTCNVSTWNWVDPLNSFGSLILYDYPASITLNRYVVTELKTAIEGGIFDAIMSFEEE